MPVTQAQIIELEEQFGQAMLHSDVAELDALAKKTLQQTQK
jgi:hypothetical protein